MRTSEQIRAEHALARVHDLNTDAHDLDAHDLRGLYRSYVDRLGPAIMMNGLGQALATERAASAGGNVRSRAHRMLYDNLQGWLCRDDGNIYPGGADLLQAIMANDQSKYLLAQAEALAWLDWHKKFCRAELPEGGRE